MTRSYRTLSEINPELLRSVTRNAEGPMAPEESTSGLMGPPSRFSGRSSTPVSIPEDTQSDSPSGFYERVINMLFDNSDEPERVSQALTRQNTTTPQDLESYVNRMESLPPVEQTLGIDQTRNALGEAEQADFEETASRLTTDLMRDFDLTETQAAAIVGNLAVESANFQTLQEIDPVVEGSRGGYGFAQWTGPRRRAYEAWAAENNLDPSSYEANYGYLRKELSETDDVIGNIGRNTIARLRETDNLQDATSLVMEYYLRPGVPHEERRQASAQQILGLMSRQE